MRTTFVNFISVMAALTILSMSGHAFAEDVTTTNEVTVYGSIQPSKKVVISARAAGTIKFMPSIEGAEVKSGEVVLLIDKEDYELRANHTCPKQVIN